MFDDASGPAEERDFDVMFQLLKGLEMRPTPAVLYHYTDARGLVGILETKRLFATDAEFLNDPDEGKFALRRFRAIAEHASRLRYGSRLTGLGRAA